MDARIGIVTGRRIGKNRNRGLDTRLIQVMITDQTDIQTVQLVEQMGEESNPPNGCMVVMLPGAKALKVGVATFDGITPDLEVGGKRIYSINPEDHSVIAETRLDPDGKITLTNPNIVQTMNPDGTVTVVNQAASFTMNPDGTVTVVNQAASFTMNANGTFFFSGTGTTFNHIVTAAGFSAVTTYGGTGAITTPGTVTGTTDVVFAGKSAVGHKHSGVQTGTGQTGVPV